MEVGAATERPNSRRIQSSLGAEKGPDMDIRKAAVVKDATLGSRHPVSSNSDKTAMTNRQLLTHARLSPYEGIERTRSGVA